MRATRVSTLLALAATTAASPLLHPRQSNSTLQWAKCEGVNETLPVDCSSLDVPLDYTDPASDKKLNLQLLRVLAPVQPSKGSILTNFGGPGFEARNTLVSLSSSLFKYVHTAPYCIFLSRTLEVTSLTPTASKSNSYTNGEYDLIAFDPRGTGLTMPFSCFSSPAESALVSASYPQKSPKQTDNGLATLWAETGGYVTACSRNETAAEMAGLVGTAFVARDLMQVVDALGEDGKLRYWGISYGTTLGATVAAMFPDRVDRVVLDAVVNSHRYYHNSGVDVDQLDSADESWRQFLTKCVEAGTEKCAVAALGSTALEVETALGIARDSYRTNPVAVNGTVIDYTMVSLAYYLFARTASDLAPLTSILYSIATRTDLETVVRLYTALAGSFSAAAEPLDAIKCGDQFPRHANLSAALPDATYYMTSSPLFGEVGVPQVVKCAQWPWAARERYEGDFRVKTAKPVLLLQNTWDAATSLSSAFNMSSGFEGSVVVEQEGWGVSVSSFQSLHGSSCCCHVFVGEV